MECIFEQIISIITNILGISLLTFSIYTFIYVIHSFFFCKCGVESGLDEPLDEGI